MDAKIVPISEEHIESVHRCLDTVARERRYLAFVEAPPLEETRKFVESNIAKGHIERVELGVFASNVAARALYERLGFVVEGVKRRARKLDGEYDDVVLMALFL